MTAKSQRLLREALSLPPRSRASMAGTLIRSLDVREDRDVEAAWAAEVDRRVRDVESGKAKLIPWEQVRRSLRTGLKRRAAKKP